MDLLALHNTPDLAAAKAKAIHDALLRDSRHLKQPNFTAIGAEDLARLFALYDREYFGAWMDTMVRRLTGHGVDFRLSSTMTSAGGKTIQIRTPEPNGTVRVRYQIAIASRMLFLTFADLSRPVTVCGLTCTDRLSALQRIMEHEIIHLAELLAFGRSSCKQPRFQSLAHRIFGHTQSTHALVTPREHAAAVHAIRVGQTVAFEFDGARHVGKVNRIHHRATVLVPSPSGQPYSDGQKYHKFYVPLPLLRAVD